MAAGKEAAVAMFGLRPMRVLAERSRDAMSGWAAARLMPGSIFQTTDSHVRVTARLLADYDVVVVAGASSARYTRGELDALEAFVKRGGTLVVASNATLFAAGTGLPLERLAHNQLAARFGYWFDAVDDLPADLDGQRGYPREELAFTAAGRGLKMEVGDLWLIRAGPLSVPKGATVVLKHAPSGRAVMAWSAYGRGKVLACHDTANWNNGNAFCAAQLLTLVDPAGRVKGKAPVPVGLSEQHAAQGKPREKVMVYALPRQAADAERVQRIAIETLKRVTRLVRPARQVKQLNVYLEAGVGGWGGWGPTERIEAHLGVDSSDDTLTWRLVRGLVDRLVWARVGWEVRTFIGPALVDAVAMQVARAMGCDGVPDLLEKAWAKPGTEDLGRVYSDVEAPARLRRFYLDVEERFGPGVLTKLFKVLPKKDLFKHVDMRMYSEFDMIVWLLAQVTGPAIYEWVRGNGHTVRQMPAAKPGSDALQKVIEKQLRQIVADAGEPASDRQDAAAVLAGRLVQQAKDKKLTFDQLAKKAGGKKVVDALPAALALAAAKDVRACAALGAFTRHKDPGVVAIAAHALVSECNDRKAADALAKVTGELDVRFQLAAGYALGLIGDERAGRWCFAGHPACDVTIRNQGMHRVNPRVDGYEVANVYSQAMVRPVQYGGGFSCFYVNWVHTAPRWRRRGIARAGMHGAEESHWYRDCATFSLHTGTRNVAHALYRDFELRDYYRGLEFRRRIHKREALLPPPPTVTIRPAGAEDRAAIAKFVNEQEAVQPNERRELGVWPEHRVSFTAWQGKTLVGVASADVHQNNAGLDVLALGDVLKKPKAEKGKGKKKAKPGKPKPDGEYRELTALALLSRLHQALAQKKVRSVDRYYGRPVGSSDVFWLLKRAGYGSRLGGGVELFRINSLRQLLSEIAPTLEARLAKEKHLASWQGRITLQGQRQVAGLEIAGGKVAVAGSNHAPAPTITISGNDAALERLVLGTTSAFEEYYQIETDMRPMLNEPTTQLLDALFPRVTPEA